ncbi:MAG: OmpL47-type beta-barrel domain-containing protein [Actinophytocola sp.]|uniref:OmpL47-type beta-barrel domain-containing protein n=1 Tax=Actinophytocola sp. TaxID=1872138 RepID=UPI003D6C4B6D
MLRASFAALVAVLTAVGLVALPAAADTAKTAADPAAAATLTWTANDSITAYASAPSTAPAGANTVVFENSTATGNTTGMTHTLTFDTSTPGYNHDVQLNIVASPFDANNGRHEAAVTLTPGKYRYFCSIPGHAQMVGEFTVTGGGEDTTPPTVTAELTGEQDAEGNYVGSATATLSATDDSSGVDSVEYSLDGGAWTTYAAPVVVNTVGDHMLHYRATDVAGNTSPEGMTDFTVVTDDGGEDTTPPTVSAEVTGEQDAEGNFVGSATVTVAATDEGSGVASVEYEVDDTGFQPYTGPVTVSDLGDHAVQYRATDAAGNVSLTGSVPFRVVEDDGGEDTTPPTVTAEVSGEQDADGNYVDSATVTLSATDAGSGVASVEYSLDGGAFAPYTAPVVVNTPGEHMLHYRATDNAGNVSPEGMAGFTVVEQDTTVPTVSGQVTGEQDPDGNYLGSAVVTITAADEGSGVASIEYSVDGAAFVPYTEPLQIDAPGEHTVAFRATDVAGNVSEEGSVSFSVVEAPDEDTTPPSVSTVVSGSQDANWNYLDSATLTIEALDVDSGVASVEYKLDDGGWTAYTEPVVVDTPGTHTVAYRATDNAGNVSAELSGSFTIVESANDACPSSDTRATVIIGIHDSGVANVDTGNGCTINDLIAEDAEYGSHNRFVRHVNRVTDELVTAGVITSQERSLIVNAAIDSDVGKRARFA